MPALDSSLAPSVAAFRRFNRAYTRFLGALNDHYLRTEFSLAEGRVLYELFTRSKPQATEIAEALALDAGYLSRILRKFEKSGLIRRAIIQEDKRAAHLLLTSKGRAAIRALNARADKQARSILSEMSSAQREKFASALSAIEETVLAGPPQAPAIHLRAHRPGDLSFLVYLETRAYIEEFGWDPVFEPFAAQIAADFLLHFDPARERCWIAEMDGRHVGHVVLMRHREERETAKLRLLYVHPDARGRGLGRQLVAECIQFARSSGYRRITLWTQSILTAAHRIYRAAGFQLIREEPHRTFGTDLTGQIWELDLV